ncbi:hypothetical protein Tco_0698185, partial [Tanacetum coccineum]
DQPQDHLSTRPRQQTSDPIAPVFELGQSLDPNIASFLRVHETDDDPFTSTNVEDEPLGGSFHASPPRSTQAPPAGHTSEGGEDHVDLDALLALANADVIVDSNIPPGGASSSHIGVSNKGKTPMVEEDITVKERTLKQMEDDRLGEEAAKRLHDEEQAQVDRQRAELNRRRQQEVLASAMYYTEADWINIMAQVEANASLSKTLLGDDVTKDNFPVRMAALIKRKKQALAEKLAKERMERPMTPVQQRTYMIQFIKNQSSALYSTGWTKAKVVRVLSFGIINLFGRLEVGGYVSYPLSVKLMERMLKHKLEIDKDVVGNDMTTAEQLIRFIKNQIAAAQFNKATKTANYMVLEGVLMKNKDAASSRDIQLICAEFSSIQVKTQADWMLLQSSYFNPQVSTSRYVVPTGRVVVPTGRYVVPAGKVIIIVSPGRLSLVPTGRVLSPGRVK